jgi:hypothetical protein
LIVREISSFTSKTIDFDRYPHDPVTFFSGWSPSALRSDLRQFAITHARYQLIPLSMS